jgi:2-polyprenyl-6-methoxyphenol hydroxylase-like FAD-dependent oxidoreductase
LARQPVGLGAALYLAQAGVATRIIHVAEKPSQESRALAVNPRTLEILEPSARGMNLGLEDAFVFGRIVRSHQMHPSHRQYRYCRRLS